MTSPALKMIVDLILIFGIYNLEQLAANQHCAVAVDKNDRAVNGCKKSGQFSKLRALNLARIG